MPHALSRLADSLPLPPCRLLSLERKFSTPLCRPLPLSPSITSTQASKAGTTPPASPSAAGAVSRALTTEPSSRCACHAVLCCAALCCAVLRCAEREQVALAAGGLCGVCARWLLALNPCIRSRFSNQGAVMAPFCRRSWQCRTCPVRAVGKLPSGLGALSTLATLDLQSNRWVQVLASCCVLGLCASWASPTAHAPPLMMHVVASARPSCPPCDSSSPHRSAPPCSLHPLWSGSTAPCPSSGATWTPGPSFKTSSEQGAGSGVNLCVDGCRRSDSSEL